MNVLALFGIFGLTWFGCTKPPIDTSDTDTTSDSDADTDADSDTDSDSDADSDSDTDSDADTDSEIYNTRTGSYAAGNGEDVVGDSVTVTGVLVGPQDPAYGSMFISDGTQGDYHAIEVFLNVEDWSTAVFAEGDVVAATGEYVERSSGVPEDSQAQVVVTDLANIASSTESIGIPAESVVSVADLVSGGLAEGLESAVVILENVVVTNPDDGYGEWTIADASTPDGDQLNTDDWIWDAVDDAGYVLYEGDTFTEIRGIMYWSYGEWKLLPRSADDLVGYVSNAPECPATLCAADLTAGDVTVSEVMFNPNCDQDYCEWIEIVVTGTDTVNLEGLTVEDDGGNTGTVRTTDTSHVLNPGDYIVLTKSDGTAYTTYYGAAAAGTYGSIALGNSGDQVILKNATETLFSAPAYAKSQTSAGYSWQLSASIITGGGDATDSGNWCTATDVIGSTTDYGTPGAANNDCFAAE
jgi:hypothetical protein